MARANLPAVAPNDPVLRLGQWEILLTKKRRIALSLTGLAILCAPAMAFISEFDQTRGIMNLWYSRLWLTGLCVIVFLMVGVVAIQIFKRIWQATIASGIVAVIAFLLIDTLAPRPRVVVEPATVNFDTAMPRENFIFTIRNDTDSFAYSVQLKLKMPQGSSSNSFLFDIPKDSRKPIIDGSEMADIGGVVCSDYERHPIVIFLVYRLEPHGVREISITHKVEAIATVQAKISYKSDRPLPRVDDPTQMKWNIHTDEPMVCNGAIGWWLDPSKPPRTSTFTGKKL